MRTKQIAPAGVQSGMVLMIPKILLAVAAGGALGALSRFGLTIRVTRWAPVHFHGARSW
jgi:hypothetical protein